MHYYNYLSILEKYEKLEQLNVDFSYLEFNDNIYCISLSGGVDSMVLMDILHKRNKRIIAIHINYNNREESKLEEDFLREYCNARDITFICHSFDFKRGSIKRNDYETITKKIKFDLYKKTLEQYEINGILLAHHKDDIIENIFTNFCRGDNFLNLSVIKESNIIMGVNIIRPLIKHYKQDIYDYAHFYKIPYFLDTTPDWSVRGKFRQKILPQLFNTFAGLKTNLLSIAKESDEWGSLIQTKFIDKYYKNISFGVNHIIMPIVIKCDESNEIVEDYSEYPMCFWSEIMAKVFHRYQINAPSRKSLELFMKGIKAGRTVRTVRTASAESTWSNEKNITKILLTKGTQLTINHKENIIKIEIN